MGCNGCIFPIVIKFIDRYNVTRCGRLVALVLWMYNCYIAYVCGEIIMELIWRLHVV